MRFLWLLALTSAWLPGQRLVDASRIPEGLRSMQAEASAGQMRCSVAPVKPRLNYSFRFQAGYVLDIPLQQYTGK